MRRRYGDAMRRAATILTIGLAASSLQGCMFLCEHDVTVRAPSPDGEWLAAAYVRNCGATTGFTTHVVIMEKGEKPDPSGDIFVAEAGTARRSSHGGPQVQLRWLAPDRLRVSYGEGAEVWFQAVRKRGLYVEYEVLPKQP